MTSLSETIAYAGGGSYSCMRYYPAYDDTIAVVDNYAAGCWFTVSTLSYPYLLVHLAASQ